MAITKTSALGEIIVSPALNSGGDQTDNIAWPTVRVSYFDTFSEDGAPINHSPVLREVVYQKFDSDGNDTSLDGADALVVSMCSAIWS
jgi:hypothetical protein